ncbi:MAG: hypothetical protein HYV20_07980 [Gemmatimonadetes bacterium]|nr:hypothetical protein [Gemmatimonadota bacterium]
MVQAARHRSLGVNLNLWWGLLLVVFALAMLALAIGARGKGRGDVGSD